MEITLALKKVTYCHSFGISVSEKQLSSIKVIVEIENSTATENAINIQ